MTAPSKRIWTPLLLGLGSIVPSIVWLLLRHAWKVEQNDLLPALGASLAFVGFIESAMQRWRGILWIVGSLLLHGLVFSLVVAPEAWSHERRESAYGSDGPRSGWNAGWAGDLNGDGIEDILLWTPYELDAEEGPGIERVISGSDGSVLRRVHLYHPEDWAVIPKRDLDGDGFPDSLLLSNVFVGLGPNLTEDDWENAWRRGALDVISGRDGSVLLHIDGSNLDGGH